MESLDSRMKRIEQRLSSIEKFIAENVNPSRNKDFSIKLGNTSDPIEVTPDYHYNYKSDFDPSKVVKAPIHKVDTSVFNNVSKTIVVTDDTLNTAVLGSLVILALFFIGRIVVDSAWFSQTGQISLAILISLVFVGLGYFVENGFGIYAKYLPIVGILGLNVSIFGASNFYTVVPKNLSVIAALGAAVIGLFLFNKFKMQIYVIMAVLGAYLLPLYISFQSDSVFTNFYFLFVSLVFAGTAVWMRWNQLALLSAYVSLAVCAISEYIDNDIINQVTFTLGHFVFFASAYTLTSVRSGEEISKKYSYGFFPFVLLFYIAEYYYIEGASSKWSPLLTALTSLLLFICYLVVRNFSKNEKHDLTSNLLLASGAITLVHTLFYVLMPIKFRPIALVVAGFAIFKGLESLKNENLKDFAKIFAVFMLAVIGWNYIEVVFSQFNSRSTLPFINGAIYVIIVLYAMFFESKVVHMNINRTALSLVIHAVLLATIFNLTKSQSMSIWVGSVAAYFAFAFLSSFYLYKKNNTEN